MFIWPGPLVQPMILHFCSFIKTQQKSERNTYNILNFEIFDRHQSNIIVNEVGLQLLDLHFYPEFQFSYHLKPPKHLSIYLVIKIIFILIIYCLTEQFLWTEVWSVFLFFTYVPRCAMIFHCHLVKWTEMLESPALFTLAQCQQRSTTKLIPFKFWMAVLTFIGLGKIMKRVRSGRPMGTEISIVLSGPSFLHSLAWLTLQNLKVLCAQLRLQEKL